ncbi:hypothetical protein [Promicromonospora sp. NPDC023987]|uniref:hypothetical protein n=1 Tax=Promicromonospora sp. NPDC023987 TaxID=3155360 RepID=UPI0033E72B7D
MSTAEPSPSLIAAARDWQAWLASRGLTDPAAMTAYSVADLAAGGGPNFSGPRIYCAITALGVPCYVGQTRRALAKRIAEHVRSGNARDWAYVVSVAATGSTVPELDALERSAYVWMVPASNRCSRKMPAVR